MLLFKTFAALTAALVSLVSAQVSSFADAQLHLEIAPWPPGPGSILVPQQPDDELTAMMAEVDPAHIEATITKLVSFGTRNTMSSQTNATRGIGAARDWIQAQMEGFAATSGGRMTVEVAGFIQEVDGAIIMPTNISNVVATLTGSVDPTRVYLVGGHYDSRNTNNSDFTNDAPGADDDASGVAVVLELARVMATHKPGATLMFAAFAGEEQGLFGSNFLATTLASKGMNIEGMLNNDIVGSSTADDGTTDPFNIRMFTQGLPSTETLAQLQLRATIGAENDSPIRQLGRFVAEVSSNSITQMNVQMDYRQDRYLRGGDHVPFIEQGFPAVRFTEPHENFAHQHQNVRVQDGVQFGDLIEFCDFEFTARVARVNGVALWSLAQAPGTPKGLTMDLSVLTNNSTLKWTDDPLAASYEVVWRASEDPFWTHVIPVGKVSEATILLSKDNAQFGVRAVGANGFKSPAAFQAIAD
ncbi:Peptide hydrolase [Mycena chlorophos]|uniref:Peptide hydrolase n=1 Tax=Mycena chlorophos TaxID=658473 RepID=A0A8H6SWL3_MYCCL|nr:Peptide hydrolase [Mycena chlorophos]